MHGGAAGLQGTLPPDAVVATAQLQGTRDTGHGGQGWAGAPEDLSPPLSLRPPAHSDGPQPHGHA